MAALFQKQQILAVFLCFEKLLLRSFCCGGGFFPFQDLFSVRGVLLAVKVHMGVIYCMETAPG